MTGILPLLYSVVNIKGAIFIRKRDCFGPACRRVVPASQDPGVFFDDLDLQIVEGDLFYETVLAKASLGRFFELFYIRIQPDGYGQVEGAAGCFERCIDLPRAVQAGRIFDRRIVL